LSLIAPPTIGKASSLFPHEGQIVLLGSFVHEFERELRSSWLSGRGFLDGSNDIDEVGRPDVIVCGGDVGGRFHLGWGIVAIEADCSFSGAGVALCHLVVDFLAIGADGCPKAGDLVCHLVVDLSAIGSDGCPKAGDLVCHLVVGLWFIGADEETSSSGGVLAVGMSVAIGVLSGGISSLVVHSIPSNLKVLGGWCRWRWGDLVDLGESIGTSNLPRISLAGNVGDMSATCQQLVKMSMNLGIFACGCRHQNSPDTRFLCQKLPTLYIPHTTSQKCRTLHFRVCRSLKIYSLK
jgi:hypothetical protein